MPFFIFSVIVWERSICDACDACPLPNVQHLFFFYIALKHRISIAGDNYMLQIFTMHEMSKFLRCAQQQQKKMFIRFSLRLGTGNLPLAHRFDHISIRTKPIFIRRSGQMDNGHVRKKRVNCFIQERDDGTWFVIRQKMVSNVDSLVQEN